MNDYYDVENAIGDVVSSKFGLYYFNAAWQAKMEQTHGHTGEDMFLHAFGSHQGLFSGTMKIWEIPHRMAAALGLGFP